MPSQRSRDIKVSYVKRRPLRPTRPPLQLFCFRERGWGSCQVGIPDISPAFPLPIGLFFPDLDVFALVGRWLATGVVHGEFIGAANETKIPGFGDFNFGSLPAYNQPGSGEKIAPKLLDRAFSRGDRRVWRQDNGVVSVVRDCFLQVFAGRGLRPGVVSVAKRLFGFRVAGQTDGGCGEADRESN